MTSDLIVVGASARAAAQSALQAGFRPYAIDQFADRDLQAICPAVKVRRYPHDLLRVLADAPQSPWIYTGGLENHPRLVERMAQVRPLWGNPGSVLARVRDPWQLADAVREAGVEMPTMVREIDEPFAEGVWLEKPLRSSGGHKVSLARRGQRRRGYYYQQLVTGRSYGAVYLAGSGDCRLLGVSRQVQAADSFAYQGSIVDSGGCHGVDELALLGTIIAQRFQLRGLFNIDLVRSERRLWPLEVNPRYSASVELLERATGVSFLRLHAQIFRDGSSAADLCPASPPPQRAFGKRIVYSPTAGTITATLDELVSRWNAGPSWPRIADLPRAGDLIEPGQPVCTVFAEGATAEEVERYLQQRRQQVLHVAIARRSR